MTNTTIFSTFTFFGYYISSYPLFLQANLFGRLFTCPPGESDSQPLPEHINKHLLKCTFAKNLPHNLATLKGNSRQPYNQYIKVQVKILKYWKKKTDFTRNPQPWSIARRGCFSNSTRYLWTIQIIYQYPISGENECHSIFKTSELLTSRKNPSTIL